MINVVHSVRYNVNIFIYLLSCLDEIKREMSLYEKLIGFDVIAINHDISHYD